MEVFREVEVRHHTKDHLTIEDTKIAYKIITIPIGQQPPAAIMLLNDREDILALPAPVETFMTTTVTRILEEDQEGWMTQPLDEICCSACLHSLQFPPADFAAFIPTILQCGTVVQSVLDTNTIMMGHQRHLQQERNILSHDMVVLA